LVVRAHLGAKAKLMKYFYTGSPVLFFLILLFTSISYIRPADVLSGEKKAVYLKGKRFLVEVARTKQEQINGLMFIRGLPLDAGMLFVYEDEGRRSFYMKNTYIPLDIIWLNKEKKVVFIKKNAEAEKSGIYEEVYPEEKAMYVLEVNAGVSDEIGLEAGDDLRF